MGQAYALRLSGYVIRGKLPMSAMGLFALMAEKMWNRETSAIPHVRERPPAHSSGPFCLRPLGQMRAKRSVSNAKNPSAST